MKRNHYKRHEPTQKLKPVASNSGSADTAGGLHPATAVAPPPTPSHWASLFLIVVCLALASAQGK